MLDYLFKNADIVDGSGEKIYRGSVGVKDGKIVSVKGDEEAAKVIDASGKVLSPGFIDAHSHGDLILGSESARMFKTTQGVTTEVTGQCSLSMAPIDPALLPAVQAMLTVAAPSFPDEMAQWTNFPKYLEYVEKQKLTTNVKMFVGHSALRLSAMGLANREQTAAELDTMKGLLKEAIEAGAAGLSTGLIYTPCCYSKPPEIVELAKVIEPYGGVYASHMRNESDKVIEAVKETIDVGRKAGVLVDISHHKVMGKGNWGWHKETLALIHSAWDEGIRVVCDQYPYECSMTSLAVCIPPWHFDKGMDYLAGKLADPEFRALVRAEIEDPNTPFENQVLNCGGWDGVFCTLAPMTPDAQGKYISDYAAEIGKDPYDAFFDICLKNACRCGAVYRCMSMDDVIEIFKDPYCIVGSDGLTRDWREPGHPRASATFPHAINLFAKEKKVATLEEVIHKMTGLTAYYLDIPNEGLIKEGYDADLVLFDYENLKDTATYSRPNSVTEGIEAVFVNGVPVYRNMEFTGEYPAGLIKNSWSLKKA